MELLEGTSWPSVHRKINDERARRIEGLLHCDPDDLIGEQQFIAALDWVVDQATPKDEDDEDSIYD